MADSAEVGLSKAGRKDLQSIRDLVYDVWPVAYAGIISREQIDYMLDKMYSDESLIHQMETEKCEFILAKRNNELIGFASVSEVHPGTFKLHKLYVLTGIQGSGCGKTLLLAAEKHAKENNGLTIELQVNKQNRAVFFYEKMGYHRDEELVLDIGNGFVMDDYIMRKKLA